MATISLCMIVKNEEKVLKRCLNSIYDLVDEIIIVDTGSTDSTKSIALEYTSNVYDFDWIDDFSAARNYSFSKCNMDYIYVADADEYLDDDNRLQFRILKENLYDEIEIVQMMYETISNDTVLNVYREYRPKLFKRLRQFIWINPVHETVRLDPLVFDSDVVITHAPESNHASRDFNIFEKRIAEYGELPDDLIKMYALELYKNGNLSDFIKAMTFFAPVTDFSSLSNASGEKVLSTKDYYRLFITAKYYRLSSDNNFESYSEMLNDYLEADSSEVCFELGRYYLDSDNYEKAISYFNRARIAESCLDIHTSGDYALISLIECCEKVINKYSEYIAKNGSDDKMDNLIAEYRALLDKYKLELIDWKMPEEQVY